MSDLVAPLGLLWRCARCLRSNWLHYEHCADCGHPRPAPPAAAKPSDTPMTEQPRPETWPLIPLGAALRSAMNDEQKRELGRLLDIATAAIIDVNTHIIASTGMAIDTDDLFRRSIEMVRARREYAALKRGLPATAPTEPDPPDVWR